MAKKISGQWRSTWQALSKPNKVTFVLSVTAIALTIASLTIDVIQNKQQNDLNREMLLFQIEADSNSRDQAQKQIDIQNTQTALNAQLEAIARLQAFPLMVVISPEKTVLVVKQIGETNTNTLLVSGSIDTVLANNGGARAGLIEINWLKNVDPTQAALKLDIDQVHIGEAPVPLPTSIEGQTPVKIQIHMNAEMRQPEISENERVLGNRDYQLQDFILTTLSASRSEVDIQFSNADTLIIPVSKIVFDIDGFSPHGPTTISPSIPGFWDRFFSNNNVFVSLLVSLVALMGYFISMIYIRTNKITGSLIFTDGSTTIAEFGLYNGTNTRTIRKRELNKYPHLMLKSVVLKNIGKKRRRVIQQDDPAFGLPSDTEQSIRADCVSASGRKFSIALYPHTPVVYSEETVAQMMYEPVQ